MAAPLEYPERKRVPKQENYLHYLSREGRIVLRWVILFCAVAIVVLVISGAFAYLAPTPALLGVIAFVLLVLVNQVERRSDRDAHRALRRSETAIGTVDIVEDHAEDDQLPQDQTALIKRETKIGLAIVGSVLLVALIVAMIFLPPQVVAIGAFVFFAYLLFIAAPLWLGWFNDDIDIETRRMQDRPEPKQATTKERGQQVNV